MPVDINLKQEPIYQREQYGKGGIGQIYWDYRDRISFSFLDRRDVRVIDIGCGEGITLEKAGGSFPEKCFFGIDGLQENLMICREHHLQVIGGDAYQLPLRNEVMDCVLLMEVIEHLGNPERAISEIRRILRPQGRLILVFPNDRVFKLARIMTLKWKEALYDPGHLRQWTPKMAKEMVKRHGFRVIRQRSIPFVIWQLSLHHLMICEKEKHTTA